MTARCLARTHFCVKNIWAQNTCTVTWPNADPIQLYHCSILSVVPGERKGIGNRKRSHARAKECWRQRRSDSKKVGRLPCLSVRFFPWRSNPIANYVRTAVRQHGLRITYRVGCANYGFACLWPHVRCNIFKPHRNQAVHRFSGDIKCCGGVCSYLDYPVVPKHNLRCKRHALLWTRRQFSRQNFGACGLCFYQYICVWTSLSGAIACWWWSWP